MVELIRELCKKNGTTVKALEEELQLGKATVRRWDDNSPSISKVAQRLLGHAQISTTLDIYTHVRDEAVRDAAARMNASF